MAFARRHRAQELHSARPLPVSAGSRRCRVRAMHEVDRNAVRFEHRGESAAGASGTFEAAFQPRAVVFAARARSVAATPSVEQGDAHFAVAIAQPAVRAARPARLPRPARAGRFRSAATARRGRRSRTASPSSRPGRAAVRKRACSICAPNACCASSAVSAPAMPRSSSTLFELRRRPRAAIAASPRSTNGSRRSGPPAKSGSRLQRAAAARRRGRAEGDHPRALAVAGRAGRRGARVRRCSGQPGRSSSTGSNRRGQQRQVAAARPPARAWPGRARSARPARPAAGCVERGARGSRAGRAAPAPARHRQLRMLGHGVSIRPGLESRAKATKLWPAPLCPRPARPTIRGDRPMSTRPSCRHPWRRPHSRSAATTPPTSMSATSACRSRRSARWSRNSACRASNSAKWRWARCSSIPSDWNLAAKPTLSSGLSPLTPGITLQRACGTGLDTVDHRRQQDRDSARSRPASAAARTPPPTCRSSVNKKLRRRLLDAQHGARRSASAKARR